jgi:hypothetical protein
MQNGVAGLIAYIFTLKDMVAIPVIAQVEEAMDSSPLASVAIIRTGRGKRRPWKRIGQFTGSLTEIAQRFGKEPVYCTCDTDPLGEFSAGFILSNESPMRNPPWSHIMLSLSSLASLGSDETPLISPKAIAEFRRLTIELAAVVEAFYCVCGEVTVMSQGSQFSEIVRQPRLKGKHGSADLERELPDVYWTNYFGPGYVKFWGKDKMNALATKYEVEWLDSGATCVQTTPEPMSADLDAKGITDYPWKRHFYMVLGYDTFVHERQNQGQPGQYVPMFEEHRKMLRG